MHSPLSICAPPRPDGAENDFPALRIADGDGNVMLSVIDMGETGDLHVTGDGVIGSVSSTGPRALQVMLFDPVLSCDAVLRRCLLLCEGS